MGSVLAPLIRFLTANFPFTDVPPCIRCGSQPVQDQTVCCALMILEMPHGLPTTGWPKGYTFTTMEAGMWVLVPMRQHINCIFIETILLRAEILSCFWKIPEREVQV